MTAVTIGVGYVYLAALLVGIVLLMVRRRRHPRRSTFAAIGMTVLLVVAVVQGVVLPLYGARIVGLDTGLLLAIRAVVAVFQIIGWALVIAGLLARERDVPQNGPPRAGWPPPPAGGPWAAGAPGPPPAGPPPGWPPPGPPPGGRR
jgi:hypothetical protein